MVVVNQMVIYTLSYAGDDMLSYVGGLFMSILILQFHYEIILCYVYVEPRL